MLKLRELQKKQTEQKDPPTTAEEKKNNTTEQTEQGTGYVLKKQNSKELADIRNKKKI